MFTLFLNRNLRRQIVARPNSKESFRPIRIKAKGECAAEQKRDRELITERNRSQDVLINCASVCGQQKVLLVPRKHQWRKFRYLGTVALLNRTFISYLGPVGCPVFQRTLSLPFAWRSAVLQMYVPSLATVNVSNIFHPDIHLASRRACASSFSCNETLILVPF